MGAGLMIESVIRLLHVNPGFDPDHLILVEPGLPRGQKYDFSEGSRWSERPVRSGCVNDSLHCQA